MIATKNSIEPQSWEPLPNSTRVYAAGRLHPTIRVPFREVKLSPTRAANGQAEAVGKVENLIVDLPAGRVVAVILSTGGFLGLGDELSAVPPAALGFTENRSALGARLRVVVIEQGRERSIYKHVAPGGSFSGNPLRQTIGLGKAERIVRCEVLWPRSGQVQVIDGLPLDGFVRIVEGQPGFTPLPVAPVPFPRR